MKSPKPTAPSESTAMPFPLHPAAEVFPLLEGKELEALVEDIKQHGLREPITMHDGQILDGRNRLRACIVAGRDPHYRGFQGDDPIAFIISANAHRRHLTRKQKQQIIDALLKSDPNRSDNATAKVAKVDGKTVAARRATLEARSEIPNVQTRTDSKGRQQRSNKARRNNPDSSQGNGTKANMSVAIQPADGLIVRGDSSIVSSPLEPLLETSKTEPVTPAMRAPPELAQALTVLLQHARQRIMPNQVGGFSGDELMEIVDFVNRLRTLRCDTERGQLVADRYEQQSVNGGESVSIPPPPASAASDATHAINTSTPKQTVPDTAPEPGAYNDPAWEQVRAELIARVGGAQLTDGDELELQVWRIRGFDPAVCLTLLREHFDSQANPASLEALSLPLVRAHRAAGREYMGRTDALKLATAHVRNAALSQL